MFVCILCMYLYYYINVCMYMFVMYINVQKNVNAEIRPPSKQGLPVLVDFNIFVADINSINVEDMDFR